ncbi:hypothetical protein L873DRAFT_1800465, partial [Choiromyces venosus 120613-1]
MQEPNYTSYQPTSLLERLPTELKFLISEHLSIPDLNSLLCTNKHFTNLLTKKLLDTTAACGSSTLANRTRIYTLAAFGRTSCLDHLFDLNILSTLPAGNPLIYQAVKDRQPAGIISALLDYGFAVGEVGSRGEIPLCLAAGMGLLEVVRMLIWRDDVDVDAPLERDLEFADAGWTALTFAIVAGEEYVTLEILAYRERDSEAAWG